MGVSGRPILASALSSENRVTFPGNQLNEAGTAVQTRAAEANMLSFFIHHLPFADDKINRRVVFPVALLGSTQGLPSRNPNSDAHENPKTLSILGQRSHRVLPEMLPERFPPGQAVTMCQREVNSMTY